MFYFCFKQAALKHCCRICSDLFFRHERMRRWRVVGYSWAAYSPSKTSSQPIAWLLPSSASGTVFRCCRRRHWGCSQAAKADGAHGRLSGASEPRGPAPPRRVLGPGPGTICPLISLFTCVFPPEIVAHNSAFSNIKVLGTLPSRTAQVGCTSPPSSSSCSSEHPAAGAHPPRNRNPTGTPIPEGLRHATFSTTSKICLTPP